MNSPFKTNPYAEISNILEAIVQLLIELRRKGAIDDKDTIEVMDCLLGKRQCDTKPLEGLK